MRRRVTLNSILLAFARFSGTVPWQRCSAMFCRNHLSLGRHTAPPPACNGQCSKTLPEKKKASSKFFVLDGMGKLLHRNEPSRDIWSSTVRQGKNPQRSRSGLILIECEMSRVGNLTFLGSKSSK